MICSVFKPSRIKNGKSVKQRTYWGQYRLVADGKIIRVPLYTPDRQVATERLRKIVVEAQKVAEGMAPPPISQKAAHTLLEDHLDEYTADLSKRGVAGMYVYNVEKRVQRLLKECEWSFPRDVTADSFIGWRSHQEKAAATLNQYLEAIHGLMKWMVNNGRISANPVATVTKVQVEGRQVRTRRAFTDAEAQRLLLTMEPEERAAYLAAVFTGLRRGELEQLVWADVHLDADPPFILARASITKNHKEKVLWLHDDLTEALTAIRPQPVSPDAPVFPKVPSIYMHKKRLSQIGMAYKDELGRQADFHALRKTLATNLHRTGASARVAMDVMRHSDMRLTASVYTDSDKLPSLAAVRNLPSLLHPQTKKYAQLDAQNSCGTGDSGAEVVATSRDAHTAQPHVNQGESRRES